MHKRLFIFVCFNGAIDGTALDSELFVSGRLIAKGAELHILLTFIDHIARSFLEHLQAISNNLALFIKLNDILSFSQSSMLAFLQAYTCEFLYLKAHFEL